MQSAWTDRDADSAVARYANLGRDLALRVYTRLLGQDPRLVLHGAAIPFQIRGTCDTEDADE